jgi:hypothetical protein
LEEKSYEATVDGLREAASEFAENATSTESVGGGKDGSHLPEVATGDHGDVGMPPAEEDGLSIKDAAKRLADHRNQRDADRAALNKAIGLDSAEPQDELTSEYTRLKQMTAQIGGTWASRTRKRKGSKSYRKRRPNSAPSLLSTNSPRPCLLRRSRSFANRLRLVASKS